VAKRKPTAGKLDSGKPKDRRRPGRGKRRELPPLTPRAKEIVNHVINTVALGNHDNDGEMGAIAQRLEMTPARLQTMLGRLVEQGYLTMKGDFVYPTVAALLWQNPDLPEAEARRVLAGTR
jgi:hypothetical protein